MTFNSQLKTQFWHKSFNNIKMMAAHWVGGPQDHPSLMICWEVSEDSAEGHTMTDFLIFFYHDWYITAKISKQNQRKDQRNHESFQECSSSGVTGEAFNSPAMCCENACKILSTNKCIRNSAPRVLAEGWSHRPPLPSISPKSRFPKGKQALYIVGTNCLGTVSHSYQFCEWWTLSRNPSFQMPVKGLLANGHLQG